MPTYEVYLTYSVFDTIRIEADSAADATSMVDTHEPELLPYSVHGGYTMGWDDINIDAIYNEDGEVE